MANPGNPVLPTYNIQAPAGHAYPPALRQLRLRAGPQLNTGEPPWTRHRNTTSGENWDHAPWETRPPNYSIPLNPNLPALHSRSDQRDVNRLLTDLELSPIVPGNATADASLRNFRSNSQAETEKKHPAHIHRNPLGIRPFVFGRQVSALDAGSRANTFAHHVHRGDLPSITRLSTYYNATTDRMECVGEHLHACMRLRDYSALQGDLLDAIADNAKDGGLIAMIASEQQPGDLMAAGGRLARMAAILGVPRWQPERDVWHVVGVLAIRIKGSDLPNYAHLAPDLLARKEGKKRKGGPRYLNPLVDPSEDRSVQDIDRLFIYDPSYPHLGLVGLTGGLALTAPGDQPERSQFKHHLFLRRVKTLVDQADKERGRETWMLKDGNVRIGGGGNVSNVDECLQMTANWMQQIRHLLGAFQLARQRLSDYPLNGDLFQSYITALKEFADAVSDFDPITLP